MISIKIKTDEKTISSINDQLSIIISPDENNALSIQNKKIVVTKGEDGDQGATGEFANSPGNGIDGEVNTKLKTLRLNNTVSRAKSGDPDPDNEGEILFGENGLINRILDSISPST